jgi:histidyl-tRNA synthetase
MALSKKPYKGTRDLFPREKRRQDYIFGVMKKTALEFSYEPYDGPLLEEVDLYRAKSGDELINDQIYSFTDRGNREVAVRPEMTPTVARMVSQVHREVAKPIRWFSIPNLMRYEKPQRGRLREHWQFNIDIFGAPGILGEFEIIQVVIKLFQNYNANSKHFGVNLNDRRFVDQCFKILLKLEDEQCYKLYKIVDKAKKVSPEALDKMIGEVLNGDQVTIFKDYIALKSFDDLFAFAEKNNISNEISDFRSFYNKLEQLELLDYVDYDPTIVRGLDYYTGIVFEAFDKHPDNRRALCGGGAYANLLQIFNEPALAGVGFGLGDVTLTDFLDVHELFPNLDRPENDILISYQDDSCENASLKLARELRQHSLNVEVYLGTAKPKKLFTFSEKKGHKFLSMIGTNELEQDEVQIRNLTLKESKNFKLTDIIEIKKYLIQGQ